MNERVCEDEKRVCPDRWMSEMTRVLYCPNGRCLRADASEGEQIVQAFFKSLTPRERLVCRDYLYSKYGKPK